MKILQIHHCSVLVKDLDRALEFYCGVLGMEQNTQRPDLGYPGAWLQTGEQQIHLMQLPNPYADADMPMHGGRDRHIAMHLDDLQELISRLEQAGITYTRSKSGRPALFCRDPDHNALEFIQATN